MSRIQRFSKFYNKSMTPISMKTLLDSGEGRLLGKSISIADEKFAKAASSSSQRDIRHLARLQIASFLRREMPVRFSHKILDLENMPYGVGKTKGVKKVQEDYMRSCEELLEHPEVFEDDKNIQKILEKIFLRHNDTLIEMARGLYEYKQTEISNIEEFSSLEGLHEFLDRFFLSRIGIRVLIGHYLELVKQMEDPNPNPDYVGIICNKTSAADVALQAAQDAKYMCERQYGEAPDVEMLGRVDLTFSYIPSHLYYILFELLKNSMRAVTEFHSQRGGELPRIRIIVADGEENEDVALKIMDLGGGIPRSHLQTIFSYLFTTAGPVGDNLDGLEDFGRENPLAGLGYGLPISRLYLKYFGGQLELKSMEGHGTDSFVHLSRLTNNEEPLL
eukprot:augustus_masked-scaffold_2-processed-gene-5.53-mRNA-1 protein AED:0.00 eAED:0.00 QI:0/-1/0/1/-1/1/1/0/389